MRPARLNDRLSLARTFTTADAAELARAMYEESPRLDEHKAGHVANDVARTVMKTLAVAGQDGSQVGCSRDQSAPLLADIASLRTLTSRRNQGSGHGIVASARRECDTYADARACHPHRAHQRKTMVSVYLSASQWLPGYPGSHVLSTLVLGAIPEVMAAMRNVVIDAMCAAEQTNIAATYRHFAARPHRSSNVKTKWLCRTRRCDAGICIIMDEGESVLARY